MIHATRPFVESEWIQTKIEGQEVSGTVEVSGCSSFCIKCAGTLLFTCLSDSLCSEVSSLKG